MGERGLFIVGGLISRGEFVMQRGAGFCVDGGQLESFFVPTHGSFRHFLFQETLCQPGVGLHGLAECVSALDRLTHLLQFTDGFVQQPHFLKGDTEIVVGVRVLGGTAVVFHLLLEIGEDVGEGGLGLSVGGRWRSTGNRRGYRWSEARGRRRYRWASRGLQDRHWRCGRHGNGRGGRLGLGHRLGRWRLELAKRLLKFKYKLVEGVPAGFGRWLIRRWRSFLNLRRWFL